MITVLLLITTWDTSSADYVIWIDDDTEVFLKQGKQYGGGECVDLYKDGDCVQYYWKDKSGRVHFTRVRKAFMYFEGYLLEITDEDLERLRLKRIASRSP